MCISICHTNQPKRLNYNTVHRAISKDQSTFLRRRQTENNIDSLQEKLGECSFSHPPPPSSLPAKKEGSSGSADADEDEKKKTNEEANKPRLFVMESQYYYLEPISR